MPRKKRAHKKERRHQPPLPQPARRCTNARFYLRRVRRPPWRWRVRRSARTPSRWAATIAFTMRASGCREPRRKRFKRHMVSSSRRTFVVARFMCSLLSLRLRGIVVGVVARLRAEQPVVPRDAWLDGVGFGSVPEERSSATTMGGAHAAAPGARRAVLERIARRRARACGARTDHGRSDACVTLSRRRRVVRPTARPRHGRRSAVRRPGHGARPCARIRSST